MLTLAEASQAAPLADLPLNTLLRLGIILAIGLAGSRLAGRIGAPQLLGSVLVGLLLGPQLGVLRPEDVRAFREVMVALTLALIGFGVGSELTIEVLRRLGRGILQVALWETTLTLVFVACATRLLVGPGGWAPGLLLGSLAMATGPTTTAAMLREVGAKGPLTTTILAAVGLDQVIGLIAFSAALPLAILMAGAGGRLADPMAAARKATTVILASPALGIVLGLVVELVARRLRNRGELMIVAISAMALAAGLAQAVKPWLSLLLVTLFAGATLVNRDRVLARRVFESTAGVMPLVYVVFFVLAGASIKLGHLGAIGALGGVYILARCLGKWLGAWLGACLGKLEPGHRRRIGLGLWSQGGVAIALALTASDALIVAGGAERALLAQTVESVILGSTLVLFVIGPPAVRWAVSSAGEVPGV